MAIAHLPTSAKDGFRTHGLIAERGHAEAAKQMAPCPLASEITTGTTTSSTKSAPKIAAPRARRRFPFVMASEHTLARGSRVIQQRRSPAASAVGEQFLELAKDRDGLGALRHAVDPLVGLQGAR